MGRLPAGRLGVRAPTGPIWRTLALRAAVHPGYKTRSFVFQPRSGALGLTPALTYRANLGMIFRPAGRVWRCISLAEVRLQEGESLENALRRFKRKVQQEDIIKEVKRHSFYLKPGEKKRVKAALARKRARKKTRKEQD
jgi:small subunit ribosomal protein S21